MLDPVYFLWELTMKCATFASLAAVMLLGAWPQTSDAQDAYPNKPIRVIVASSAGGTIGTEIAARAAPDGYTLTMGTTSTHVIAPVAYPKVKYDPVRDFDALTLVATIPASAGAASRREVSFARGFRRARKIAAAQDELRVGRRGLHHAPRDGNVEKRCGHRSRACAVQR